ncbi:YdeI/OmpD-associated family protein [Galactobacter sp.]|uniref:YdeI/OmpD-associated family protein n=1 Tax=Galactobacter sp. TaxID=2676125 RepID=UPI0025BAFB8A|nr:YdeI/OmpD-associated family protein [Galactobacter sp.]
MTPISFTGTVEVLGIRHLLRLPQEASLALASRGQVAATVTVDGSQATTVVEPDGRRGHWLNLDALGIDSSWEPGTEVSVDLEPTKTWPEVTIPDDLRSALDAAPDLEETWVSLTPMARWEWVRWVQATRSEATRAKRVGVSVDKLRHGKRRPCCFDLSSCTDPEVARSAKLPEA